MPESKNRKFYYLLHGESVRFKVLDVENWIIRDSGHVRVERLADPIKMHISAKPFPSGRKMEPCAGAARCSHCLSKHKPQTLFPISMIAFPDEPMEKEYLIDLSVVAHNALIYQIQKILDNGGTTTDILNTVFELERQPRDVKPNFVCKIRMDTTPELILDKEEFFEKLTDADMLILRKIDNAIRTKKYGNTRGSVIKTLQENYHWPDTKIELAFTTVLDDNGFLIGEKK